MDLVSFRKSRELSQQQVAEQLGFSSKAYISGLESGDVICSLRMALTIERWSDGEVRALDILPQEDAKLLRAALDRAIAGSRKPTKAPA
jgi:transcriptional regulator with XRE-family HTH domain